MPPFNFPPRACAPGHLVYGMLKTPTLRNALLNISTEFRKIQIEKLANEFDALLASSIETTQRGASRG